MAKGILQKNRVAVVTGAGAGIGAAAAKLFDSRGMNVVAFDKNQEALDKLGQSLTNDYLLITGDVTRPEDLQDLLDQTYSQFGQCNLLFNNAGVGHKAGPWDSLSKWSSTMLVNFEAIVDLQHLFVPQMLKQESPSAIVNLGSKEGITTPPGNVAYSVSKAAVKVLTEHLAHELRNTPNHKVSAHLLVPGYTWTPMNFPEADFDKPETKPTEPWSPDELMAFFEERFEADDFYIIALDNEVTKEMDTKRMTWAMGDLIHNRPALSHWHPDYKEKFEAFMDRR